MAGRHRRPRPARQTVRAAGVLGVTALSVPLGGATAFADAPAAPDAPSVHQPAVPKPSTPAPSLPTVSAQKAKDLASPVRGELVVEKASEEEGKPYEWGADGPDSFDCSGFTQYVYGEVGVDLPRTAHEQAAAVPRVAKSGMQRGDLVFFYDSNGYVYHVGIYAGNNEIWAATKPGDTVRTQEIWTSAYTVGRPHV